MKQMKPDVTADAGCTSDMRRARERRAGASPSHVGVSLVVPAMNEARNIGWVLDRIPSCVDEVILVDNSTDDTIEVARRHRPDIRVVGQSRPGKGNALRSGFAAARGDVIVMIDADCSMDPKEISRYIPLLDEGFDLVKGSRFMEGGGTDDMELLRRFGNGALRNMVNVLYGAQFTDLCYGFSAFRRDCLPRMALAADGFEIETEIIVRSIKSGMRIAEVPSFEAPRAHGTSNLNTWRDGRRVLKTLLKHRLARRPPQVVDVATTEVAPVLALAPDLAVAPLEAHG
jgi:glycosyltransferase involved in cell wall biosynthesis